FELDDDHPLFRAHRARDLERDLQVHVERVDADVHPARTASIRARARRSAPASPSRIGSAATSFVASAASRGAEASQSSLAMESPVLSAIAITRARGQPGG